MKVSVSYLLGLLSIVFAGNLRAGDLLPADTPPSRAIDHYIDRKLKADHVIPASPADPRTLLRRLTLDLAGRIPTAPEVRAYVESHDANKRVQWTDRLLSSPDYALHQRNELDALLQAGRKTDRTWRAYLLTAVQQNYGWDRLFREMMIGSEQNPAQRPALEFLKVRVKNVDDMTNDTAAIFFGVSVNCAKCHDHPFVEQWKQDSYFGFVSFFARTYLTRAKRLAEKSNGTVTFKTVDGTEKRARPMFLTGTVISQPAVKKTKQQLRAEQDAVRRQKKDPKAPPPKRPTFSLREQLVKVALKPDENRFFARSIVNRIWARLMGRGLVHPLDQMHAENEASHPELLAWLSRDLISHHYDLKRLIRGIVLSRTYARSSRWKGSGSRPGDESFAVAIPRPLSPRQYALSLLIASTNPQTFPIDVKPAAWNKRRNDLERRAESLAGRFELPGEHFQVSVEEALFLSNSRQINETLLRDAPDHMVGYLKTITDRRKLIDAAFRGILSRPPNKDESQQFGAYLSRRRDRRADGIRQIVWTLLASPEMRFNF